MPTLMLYTKSDCGLCDEARDALERVRERVPFQLQVVDVASSPQLRARYGERIPLVTVDGEEAYEYVVDEADLVQRIEAAAGASG